MSDVIEIPRCLKEAAADFSVFGHGVPVVLLHSSMSHKGQWRKLAQQLAPTRRVIAIDLFGYGNAPHLDSGYPSLHDEARRVKTVLRGIFGALPALELVGHSFGGAVALRLARMLPHRVTRVALFEPTAFHILPAGDDAMNEVAEIAARMALHLKQGARARAVEIFLDYWAGRGAYAALPTHLQCLFARQAVKALRDFSALFNEPAALADYARIEIPVCLIAGRHSPASSRRVATLLAQNLARAALHWVDAGHMAP
ncbi:MAG: alpha/beta fold hydrolase, partial [Burkholderiales bacterium]|nr:alpha/beta fold hydrolase [Burkholderiales bacterium]